jgi:hypothetical protein
MWLMTQQLNPVTYSKCTYLLISGDCPCNPTGINRCSICQALIVSPIAHSPGGSTVRLERVRTAAGHLATSNGSPEIDAVDTEYSDERKWMLTVSSV